MVLVKGGRGKREGRWLGLLKGALGYLTSF